MTEQRKAYKIDGRPSTIYRVVKNKDNPYVMIDRRPVDNPVLSFKAKGILTYLLSRPDGWEVSVADLIKHGTEGEAAVRSGLKELKVAGHMRYTNSRQQGRITGWLIEVFEFPLSPDGDFQQVEKQDVENRTQVLSTLSNKKLNKKEAATPRFSPSDILEIEESANRTVDGILEGDRIAQEKDAMGQAWRGRELCPPNYLMYADWWHAKTQQHMYGVKGKAKINTEWLKAFKEFYENDVSLSVLDETYAAEIAWKKIISKPSELITKAVAIAALPPAKETSDEKPNPFASLFTYLQESAT